MSDTSGPKERYPITKLGCCKKYFECFTCDEMFCIHGYLHLQRQESAVVVPLTAECPKCEARRESGEDEEE